MRCGLLGEHLGHSYSPRIHRMLGTYSYELFEVAPGALDAFLRDGPFDAVNVTIPYKLAVVPYCAALSDTARRTGSVNTLLRRKDGSLFGDNTDYDGFLRMLTLAGGIAPGEKALVLGSGGASHTVQAVLWAQGAQVVTFSRRGPVTYAQLPNHEDAVMVVNATPVGMYPNNGQRLIDLSLLPRLRSVLDLIYNPLRTGLLLDAQARGLQTVDGLVMLVAQAKRAAELFLGTAISDDRCDEILEALGRQMQNLVLIGMPGCGKSTLGQALAAALGRPFFDADLEITRRIGCPIPEFFLKKGEAAFRAVETQVLQELGKGSGRVIATGGGCVTRWENYEPLHQNSRILWIRRDPAKLPVQGRPLSQQTSPEELYARRKERYAAFADLVVDNDGTPEQALTKLLEVIA